MNRFHVDLPNGESFGINIKPLDPVSINLPRLASGTVIPPRAGEFAAVLGDNRRETEVVSPLSTIEKALDNVMVKYWGRDSQGDLSINLNLDGRQIYRAVLKRNREETKRCGRNPILV